MIDFSICISLFKDHTSISIEFHINSAKATSWPNHHLFVFTVVDTDVVSYSTFEAGNQDGVYTCLARALNEDHKIALNATTYRRKYPGYDTSQSAIYAENCTRIIAQ